MIECGACNNGHGRLPTEGVAVPLCYISLTINTFMWQVCSLVHSDSTCCVNIVLYMMGISTVSPGGFKKHNCCKVSLLGVCIVIPHLACYVLCQVRSTDFLFPY